MTIRIWHQSFTDVEQLPSYVAMLQHHAGRVCSADTELVVHGVRAGSYPPGMNPIEATRYPWSNHVLATQIAHNAAQAEAEGYDAVVVSCFFDPGLREARSLVDIPVISMAETSLLLGTSVGGRFGLIGLERAQSFALRELATAYGALDRVVATVPLDPAITEAELEEMFSCGGDLLDRVQRAARVAIDAGADVIIPAEGMLNTSLVRRGVTEIDGVPVLDSYGLGLAYAEALVGLQRSVGLKVSHAGAYGRPTNAHAAHFAAVTGAVLTESTAWQVGAP
ncbi:aspartate/glutamate racemase family protein [Micromonospora sp. NPDC005206]|uniref:aspartate/glutamate racemase family protein n=1 Tax=Micromonospora sp. NPDC005206 TaxID=3157022 RepID=UPI0033B6E36D